MSDKYTDSDIHLNGKLAEKLDHFWFYYKWHTLAAIFIVFVLGVCIFQSCTKAEYDVNVLYAGPYLYSASEASTVTEELNGVMPRDFNDDGEKNTGFLTYQVLNQEQMEELRKQIAEEKNRVLDTSYFSTQSELYNSALMTGEYAILLLDESLYQKLENMEGRLRKLSDVFAAVPESAFSDYGIRFCETALYKNSKQLSALPEDTVLCLARPLVMGSSSNKATYAQMTEMFVAMAKD